MSVGLLAGTPQCWAAQAEGRDRLLLLGPRAQSKIETHTHPGLKWGGGSGGHRKLPARLLERDRELRPFLKPRRTAEEERRRQRERGQEERACPLSSRPQACCIDQAGG